MILFFTLFLVTGAAAYKNVNGGELKTCSVPGMALTGWTRSGFCVSKDGDHGSHHICINLSSTTGGNFCEVTKQPDWCSGKRTCHEDKDQQCPVQNWCVCQWAFASYIEGAGGCHHIQDIVCDSVNMEALKSYAQLKDKYPKVKAAYDCLVKECKIDVSKLAFLNSSDK